MHEYAPIVIPTLNRIDHFKNCIESLQKNSLACKTELFISVDYPPNDKYVEGYERIKNFLLNGINGFKNVTIFYQNCNLGSSGNAKFLIDKISEKFTRYIFTEDDNVFSNNYLEYMDKCFEKYEGDDSVFAISGYMWPIEIGGVGNIVSSSSLFSAWGYGTWLTNIGAAEKWLSVEQFEKFLHDRKKMKELCCNNPFIFSEFIKGFFEYSGCLINNNQLSKIDLSYSIYMFFKNKKTIYPVISKVRNCGNDGTGVHCVELLDYSNATTNNRNYDYHTQIVDSSDDFEISDENLAAFDYVEGKLHDFLFTSDNELRKCWLLYYFYRIFGRKMTVSLVRKIK